MMNPRDALPGDAAIRAEVMALVGNDMVRLKPGLAEAARLKQGLIEQNARSLTKMGLLQDKEALLF